MLGIIGGTGVESLVKNGENRTISTRHGGVGVTVGTINNVVVAFVDRHHCHSAQVMPQHPVSKRLPHEVDYRAIILALKELGVKEIIGIGAVGSLRLHYRPGDLIIPMQFIDMTKYRETSFNEGHCAMGHPVDYDMARKLGVKRCGSYVCIEGPRFSTEAESKLFRSWGADLVGMTLATECFLANEAGLGYVPLCHVTDYDSWTDSTVTMDAIMAQVEKNADAIEKVINEYCE